MRAVNQSMKKDFGFHLEYWVTMIFITKRYMCFQKQSHIDTCVEGFYELKRFWGWVQGFLFLQVIMFIFRWSSWNVILCKMQKWCWNRGVQSRCKDILVSAKDTTWKFLEWLRILWIYRIDWSWGIELLFSMISSNIM